MAAPKGNQYAKNNPGGGRPSTYRPEYADIAYRMCMLKNATEKDLAEIFGVAPSTVALWKIDHKEFADALKNGKENADSDIAVSLYERARGYSHEAVKIFATKDGPLIVPYTEHYPPDTGAAALWLKNRQPAVWRDKQEVEVTGTVQLAERVRRAKKRSDGGA